MQYLLTPDELENLQQRAIAVEVKHEDELQELCTLAAIHVPILRPWAPDTAPAPWGCILAEDKKNHSVYCDDCPARKVCPYEGKEYSQ